MRARNKTLDTADGGKARLTVRPEPPATAATAPGPGGFVEQTSIRPAPVSVGTETLKASRGWEARREQPPRWAAQPGLTPEVVPQES